MFCHDDSISFIYFHVKLTSSYRKVRKNVMNQQVTGKPSIDKPWMKYYPPQLIQGLTIPAQTVYEYLMERCPGDDVVAIHYYGSDIR